MDETGTRAGKPQQGKARKKRRAGHARQALVALASLALLVGALQLPSALASGNEGGGFHSLKTQRARAHPLHM